MSFFLWTGVEAECKILKLVDSFAEAIPGVSMISCNSVKFVFSFFSEWVFVIVKIQILYYGTLYSVHTVLYTVQCAQ